MKNTIKICMGSSCFARGNDINLEVVEKFIRENNLDAHIELFGKRCENKCAKGPNILINETEYSGITKRELVQMLLELQNE